LPKTITSPKSELTSLRVKQIKEETYLETSKTSVGKLLNFFFLDFFDVLEYTQELHLVELLSEEKMVEFSMNANAGKLQTSILADDF
jgi:hypothetical protein